MIGVDKGGGKKGVDISTGARGREGIYDSRRWREVNAAECEYDCFTRSTMCVCVCVCENCLILNGGLYLNVLI